VADRGVATTASPCPRARPVCQPRVLARAPRHQWRLWSRDAIAGLNLWGLLVLGVVGVLLIDVLEGLIIGSIGLVSSLVYIVHRSTRPHLASVGRVPGVYSHLERHPENGQAPGVLLLRLHGPLSYADAPTVPDRVRSRVRASDPPPTAVVPDLGAQDAVDLSTAKRVRPQAVASYPTDLHTLVLVFARPAGDVDTIGQGCAFPIIDRTMRHVMQEGSR